MSALNQVGSAASHGRTVLKQCRIKISAADLTFQAYCRQRRMDESLKIIRLIRGRYHHQTGYALIRQHALDQFLLPADIIIRDRDIKGISFFGYAQSDLSRQISVHLTLKVGEQTHDHGSFSRTEPFLLLSDLLDITGLSHCLLHTLHQFRAHIPGLIDHVGDRSDRHTGYRRDILDRNLLIPHNTYIRSV